MRKLKLQIFNRTSVVLMDMALCGRRVPTTVESVVSLTKPLRDKFTEWFEQYDVKRALCYLICFIAVTCIAKKLRDLEYDPTIIRRQLDSELKPYFNPDPVDDFSNYHCFPDLSPSYSLQRRGKCVRMMNRINFHLAATLVESCKYLRFGEKTPICSYKSVELDKSDYYSEEGIGEKRQVEDMIKMLHADRNLTFVDIGTNVGVYCIAAAMVSNTTVCLDANYHHLMQITRSLFLGKIINRAFMIWNVLSNKHDTVLFRIPALQNSIEPGYGKTGSQSWTGQTAHQPWTRQTDTFIKVNSITLNDMSDIFMFRMKRVFLRINVKSGVEAILKGSKHFFRKVNVRIIQMTFSKTSSFHDLILFLRNLGFFPFKDAFGKMPLWKGKEAKMYPRNIYFIKLDQL